MNIYVLVAMVTVHQSAMPVAARSAQGKDKVKSDVPPHSSGTSSAPLVDFHLDIPIPYSHMDPTSVLWMDKHKDLVKQLFFTKSNTPFEGEAAALRYFANAFKDVEQKRFEYFFNLLGSEGKKAAHLDAVFQNERDSLTHIQSSSADENDNASSGVHAQPSENGGKEGQKSKRNHPLGSLCDIRNASFGMVIQYLKSGKICGSRANTMRFGLGGK